MLSEVYWSLYFAKSKAAVYWRELDSFSDLNPAQRKQRLSEMLLAQVRYFGYRRDALPEWREAAGVTSPLELWEIWQHLPILTKIDIQDRYIPEEIRDAFGVNGIINQTGGSTGEPTRFLWDSESIKRRAAAQYYCWKKFGWRPGTPTVCLWGSPRDLGLAANRRFKWLTNLRNVRTVAGFAFDSSTVEQTKAFLNRHEQVAIYGYTSLLDQLARALQDQRYVVPENKVVAAWSGAEAVEREQAERFEDVFGTRIRNQYGGREFGAIAFEDGNNGPLKLLRPNVFIEIVDDAGRPCGPGEVGRILITTLHGRGTPFLRYENGDLGRYDISDLDESGIGALASIEGRKSGLVRLKNNRVVHNTFWGMLIKEFPQVKQFQVRQHRDQSIVIRLRGERLSDEDEQRLRGLVGNMVMDTPFRLEWVDKIPLTREGKLIQVHSEFNLE